MFEAVLREKVDDAAQLIVESRADALIDRAPAHRLAAFIVEDMDVGHPRVERSCRCR